MSKNMKPRKNKSPAIEIVVLVILLAFFSFILLLGISDLFNLVQYSIVAIISYYFGRRGVSIKNFEYSDDENDEEIDKDG